MARIEISLDEYNYLKQDNKNVYEENVKLRKENERLKQLNEQILAALDEIKESSLIERIFKWDYMYSMLNSFFITTDENEENEQEQEINEENNVQLDIKEENNEETTTNS